MGVEDLAGSHLACPPRTSPTLFPSNLPILEAQLRIICVSILTASLWCVSAGAQTGRVVRLDGSTIAPEEIETSVNRLMGAAKVAGIGIAILNNRRLVYLKAFGSRDIDNNLPLTPDSVMTAASYTKSTFAVMVMQLVQEGILNLDKPIHEYLPQPLPSYPDYQDLAGDERYKQITARMLLNHTAGFHNLRILNNGRLQINFAPGSRYAYSGEGIQLLQFVVETITSRPTNELMRARIFKPFGMARTSMVWEPAFETDYANAYDEWGRSLGPQRRTRAGAAGSMQTTLADFSRFVEGVMQRKGVDARTRAEMFKPQIAILSRRQFPTLSSDTTDAHKSIGLSYGLGWGLFASPVGRAVFKEGHDEGFQHYTVMFDDHGTGMVMMSNSSNAEGIFRELSETLIRNTYTPFDWEGYEPHSERPPLPPLPERRAVVVDPALLDSYTGRYQPQGQPVWTVARDGNRLTVVEEGDTERVILIGVASPVWPFQATGRDFYAPKTNADVTFERDAAGRVTEVIVNVKGLNLRARRID
jgi:CubicO group peptidase (beta-lactamase class C family)